MAEQDIITPELVSSDIKLTPKQEGLILLQEQGISIPDAAKMVGIHKDYAYHINKKLSLTSKKMVLLAHKATKNLLQGKGVGTCDKVKDSTILDAAKMVYDRVEPAVKQSMNLNINSDISPVDLSKYLNKDDDL